MDVEKTHSLKSIVLYGDECMRSNRYIILKMVRLFTVCFFLPIILYIILCSIKSIYPFGNVSNLAWDLNIQYADFFSYYREVLLGNADIGYSFFKSLGGSLIALWGYYLSSPLNLLLIFFKGNQIQLFVFVITSLKIALCGLTFAIFIKRKYQNLDDWQIVAGAVAYSFTQYTVGQMPNLPWLDGVYLLPLLLMAVDIYIEKGKKIFLYIMIILTITFNWYTGYMNCLFVAFYFLYQIVLWNYSRRKKFNFLLLIKQVIPFYFLEAVSVFGSMVIFLPVLIAQSGSRSFDEGIFGFATNGSLLDIVRGFMIGSPNPSKEITLFCSTVMLIMVGSFFLDRSIALYEKAISGIFLAFMIASLFFTPLEHIWVGFKFESSYQYRFLYLVIMTFLLIACRAMEKMSEFSSRTFITFAVSSILIFLFFDMIKPFDTKRLWIEILLIVVFTMFIVLLKKNKTASFRSLLITCFIAIFLIEVTFNAKILTARMYQEKADDYIAYVQNEEELVDQIRPRKGDFYRIEKTLNRDNDKFHDSYIANESLAYLYGGIQQYSSCYDSITSDLLVNLGYCRGKLTSFYHEPILPADTLLGVQYLLSEKQYAGYQQQNEYSPYNGKYIYENELALPLGFTVDGGEISKVSSNGNPFQYINDIYTGILGKPCELFRETRNYTVIETEEGVHYDITDISDGDILYARINGDVLSFMVSINSGEFQPYQNYNIISLENNSGKVTLDVAGDLPENLQVDFAILDYSKLQEVTEEIKVGAIDNLKIEGSNVQFTAAGDYVMLTVPYDSSWEIMVDGKQVFPQKGADAFMLIPLNGSENSVVTMTFHVKGKTAGAILTLVSVMVMLICFMIEKYKRRLIGKYRDDKIVKKI